MRKRMCNQLLVANLLYHYGIFAMRKRMCNQRNAFPRKIEKDHGSY